MRLLRHSDVHGFSVVLGHTPRLAQLAQIAKLLQIVTIVLAHPEIFTGEGVAYERQAEVRSYVHLALRALGAEELGTPRIFHGPFEHLEREVDP